jgi:hypothetical protein
MPFILSIMSLSAATCHAIQIMMGIRTADLQEIPTPKLARKWAGFFMFETPL